MLGKSLTWHTKVHIPVWKVAVHGEELWKSLSWPLTFGEPSRFSQAILFRLRLPQARPGSQLGMQAPQPDKDRPKRLTQSVGVQ
jgi:hypothetical protein